jgi:hypothetical protein
VFDLEREMRQPLARRAQDDQDDPGRRLEPSTTDPGRYGNGTHAEQHRLQPECGLTRAERQNRSALEHQPAEGRALA